MEYVGIESIKRSYRDILQEQGNYTEAAKLEGKDLGTPVFDGVEIHPEGEPDISVINTGFQRIGIDLLALDSQFASMAEQYSDLMNEVLLDLDAVDEVILAEYDRIQDINMITGKISDFTSVRSLTGSDFTGNTSLVDNKTFSSGATTRESVFLTVDDVSGNGYEGNKYVYNDGEFEQDLFDTSNHNFIIDNVSTSYYEYCRMSLNSVRAHTHYPEDANFDNNEAECVLSISSETPFNAIRLQSDIDNIIVKQLAISIDDGVTYQNTMNREIAVNQSEKKYDDGNYIYGAGILCFPHTNYIKLYLKSAGTLDDTLAFKKLILDNLIINNNLEFDYKDYISRYFGIICNHAYKNGTISLIPPSVLIAVALVRTGNRPNKIGNFNFWNLDYDSTLTELKSDKGKCAFGNRDDAFAGIAKYINQDQFDTKIPDVGYEYDEIDKQSVASNILSVLEGTHRTTIDGRPQQFVEKYDLRQYDNTDTEVVLSSRACEQYEQYFYRLDEQDDAFLKILDNATTLVKLDGAQRHVIRINNLIGFTNYYLAESSMVTEELLAGAVQSIAVFATEYLPPTFPGDSDQAYIQYILTINGEDYEVVPVNGHRSGIKVIRYTNYSIADNYVQHVSEPIKSAKLTVKITTPDLSYSPFVSDIKICIGRAAVNSQ